MDLSKEMKIVLQQTADYALEHRYEYITPEMLLLTMLDHPLFEEAVDAEDASVVELGSELLLYIRGNVDTVPEGKTCRPELSYSMQELLNAAFSQAASSQAPAVGLKHIVNAFWSLTECQAVYLMEKQCIRKTELLRLLEYMDDEGMPSGCDPDNAGGGAFFVQDKEEEDKTPVYLPCLNDTLRDVNPLIGRTAELARTIQVLCRRDKNNPLHIGEPGVGKTAITYGLVQQINAGNVPAPLLGARVYQLDLGSLLAGTQYRGEFEKRLKKAMAKVGAEEKPIIYIDEIHNLAGAGSVGDSSFDASNLLKPYLAEGHIRFIGATTFDEYKKYFEKNKSLARRFQNIEIKEPSPAETEEILQGLRTHYEKFHGVHYGTGVLEYAVRMSDKYINERFLPDKAIDLIDEAGAYRKLHPLLQKRQTVGKDVIDTVLTAICRIPVETVKSDDLTELAGLEQRLKGQIFGQDEAIAQSVNAVKFSRAGLLEEGRPLASLLFVGPTGVGKTEIARQLAKELGLTLLRFDMSEYGEKHTVSRLIGAPAGYVGYEEGGLLTEAVRKNPSSVLLLDEIEKAHPDIFSILLQVMDYATLTDNQGRKADFRNVILIMTSNAGANRIGKNGIGFGSVNQDAGAIMEEVTRTFQPEFRNRLNKIVVFNGMDDAMAERVAEKKLGELKAQLAARKITLEPDAAAAQLLKDKGISREFGAREVDRVIRNEIKPLFVDEILFGNLKRGGVLRLGAEGGRFTASARKNKETGHGSV